VILVAVCALRAFISRHSNIYHSGVSPSNVKPLYLDPLTHILSSEEISVNQDRFNFGGDFG
jgi:hypothetical protein